MKIYETVGNGTSAELEIIDENYTIDDDPIVRVRVREGDFRGIGKASIFLTPVECERAAAELIRLAAILRARTP